MRDHLRWWWFRLRNPNTWDTCLWGSKTRIQYNSEADRFIEKLVS